jgi:hypothetical protein
MRRGARLYIFCQNWLFIAPMLNVINSGQWPVVRLRGKFRANYICTAGAIRRQKLAAHKGMFGQEMGRALFDVSLKLSL